MATQNLSLQSILRTSKNIILNPEEEWSKISRRKLDYKNIMLIYVLPLTVIAAVISLLATWLGTFHVFGFAIQVAILQIVLPVITIIITAYLTNELAETFNSTKNLAAAFKLIAYSYTPWLLANIIASISWALSWVMIFSLYGIYLLWVGLPIVMDTPEEKKPIYTLAVVVIIFVIQLILSAIFGVDPVDL